MQQIRDTRRLQLCPCGDQLRPCGVPTVHPWRCRRTHCGATTTLRCSYCAHAIMPSHDAHLHKARAMAWRPTSPHGVQWRCHGDAVGDSSARIMAFCHFLGRRTVSVRTQLWCDRPLTQTCQPSRFVRVSPACFTRCPVKA